DRRVRRAQSRGLRALRKADPRNRNQARMTATIALVAGDPAGVGPELVAKLLGYPSELPAQIRLIAHRASLDAAAKVAGVALELPTPKTDDAARSKLALAPMDWRGSDGHTRERGT